MQTKGGDRLTEAMPFSDFDFQISEMLLVHRNSHVHDFKWTQYRGGRPSDGLVCCVSGTAQYDFGRDQLVIGEGQVMFLPSDCPYTMKCTSRTPFVHYTVNFRLSSIRADADSSPAEILSGRRRHITDPAAAAHYREIFEKLLSVWQGKGSGYQVLARAYVYELLHMYLTDAWRAVRAQSDFYRLQPALHLLDAPDGSEHSVAELARQCSLSETHFRRLFVQLLGVSPTQYRTQRRILRAKDLLRSGQYTVTEVSRITGFSDPSYFSRVFRSLTGLSPGEFTDG